MLSWMGSVKNFVALLKNGSFLVRIIDMTILIEKEFIYGSSQKTKSDRLLQKTTLPVWLMFTPSLKTASRYPAGTTGSRDGRNSGL